MNELLTSAPIFNEESAMKTDGGDLQVDLVHYTCKTPSGQIVQLFRGEALTLLCLSSQEVRKPTSVAFRYEIFARDRGKKELISSDVIKTNICNLRRKLNDPDIIQTKLRSGYRLRS